ncbi:MAG: thiamine phosphate synthase [Clostridium sp.]|jgi:thiamine-phosphate pyrophosphorylase|uniref:thiamine phosphate synthase n=1 Tax=Clostridium sp. TaxID=1506 RepID=UPI0025BBC5FE|nr:thiamine phosphate synthase [Clostridium sp.]MCH3963162.1 thiamine phosphate synthase [Clostridium sp.]MCI1716375.1 thiamine phosphate synthase [Clostridium sp.]MCI1800715.1 thiamine phosphate synthase [Clostridium sp.]MCI1814630.1 thiamine phosphate synthase [Clostridium sp.]MCI1871540.1 thiamine phosphate synthase [Clostridium sp.]
MKNEDIFKLKGSKRIISITNRHLVPEGCLYSTLEKCARLGTDAIMLREKDLCYEEIIAMGKSIKDICDRYNKRFIINGSARAALNLRAFAFHTGFQIFKSMEENSREIDTLKNKNIKIGVSIHSVREAVEVEKSGADYIIAGNIFETGCKPGLEGKGLDFLKKVIEGVDIPVIAIGGIGPSNIEEVLNTGAYGVAIMSCAMLL